MNFVYIKNIDIIIKNLDIKLKVVMKQYQVEVLQKIQYNSYFNGSLAKIIIKKSFIYL